MDERISTKTEDASQGISSMVVFIALILVSSIISGVIIGFTEKVFKATKTDGEQNVPSIKGVVNIIILEISTLGAATDELHIVFELPYVEQAVSDEGVAWVVICHPTGEANVHFDEGNFGGATELDGDGETPAAIDEFEPAMTYRMIIELTSCDLNDLEDATLVLMVDRGRTQEWKMDIGGAPYQGQDLN